MTTIHKPPVHRITVSQLAVLLPVCGLLCLYDVVVGYSALIGGLIQVVPQAWFNRQAYRFTGARQAQAVTRAMYFGEAGKIVLVAVLFITAFLLLPELDVFTLFASFVLMIPVHSYLAVRALKQ